MAGMRKPKSVVNVVLPRTSLRSIIHYGFTDNTAEMVAIKDTLVTAFKNACDARSPPSL